MCCAPDCAPASASPIVPIAPPLAWGAAAGRACPCLRKSFPRPPPSVAWSARPTKALPLSAPASAPAADGADGCAPMCWGAGGAPIYAVVAYIALNIVVGPPAHGFGGPKRVRGHIRPRSCPWGRPGPAPGLRGIGAPTARPPRFPRRPGRGRCGRGAWCAAAKSSPLSPVPLRIVLSAPASA